MKFIILTISHSLSKPEILLQSVDSVGYACVARELATIIVDLIIELGHAISL